MLRCARCGDWLARDQNCSDLAVLILHWMSEHTAEYIAAHPETRGPLAEAGLWRE